MLRQIEHLLLDLDVGDVVEIFVGVADLIVVAQGLAQNAFAPRLQHDDPFALGENHAPKRHHILDAHGLADHRKSLLPHFVVGHDVIGTVEITLVDLRTRHEAIDADHVTAFDGDRLKLLILDLKIDALGIFIAPALVFGADGLLRHFIDELLAQPVAGLLVDLPERYPLRRRSRRVERNRARNERELKIALPIGTSGCSHDELLRNADTKSTVSKVDRQAQPINLKGI